MNRIKYASRMINNNFIDIGTDHGFLIRDTLINNDFKAIGTEITKGPFINANNTIDKNNLVHRAKIYLSDGIKSVPINELNDYPVLTIMGMGGNLIVKIIEESLARYVPERLIIQANNNVNKVTKLLKDKNYSLTFSKFIKENDIIYIVNTYDLSEDNNALICKYYSSDKKVIEEYYFRQIEYFKKLKVPENREKAIFERIDNLFKEYEGIENEIIRCSRKIR